MGVSVSPSPVSVLIRATKQSPSGSRPSPGNVSPRLPMLPARYKLPNRSVAGPVNQPIDVGWSNYLSRYLFFVSEAATSPNAKPPAPGR